MNFSSEETLRRDEGVTLMEVLVAITLVAIMAAAGISNLMVALRTAKHTEVNYAANTLAISKVEELAAVDVSALDSSYNGTESSVSWNDLNITFTRVTTVTVNADSSRTLSVDVSSNSDSVPTSVNFTTTFALWE